MKLLVLIKSIDILSVFQRTSDCLSFDGKSEIKFICIKKRNACVFASPNGTGLISDIGHAKFCHLVYL